MLNLLNERKTKDLDKDESNHPFDLCDRASSLPVQPSRCSHTVIHFFPPMFTHNSANKINPNFDAALNVKIDPESS